ncbi:MAG TPA: metallopeptidase family protein [Phycisphaerae bacterium]|jgi:predicted Zn-dependent protease with MMP-like domain
MVKLAPKQFEALIERAVASIPPEFREYLDNVSIVIEPRPDHRTARRMGIDDPRELLGLYHGTPLTERSVEQSGQLPDRISLYQENIERACRSQDEVVEQVRATILHEIGHFFGLDEDDLDEVGYG